MMALDHALKAFALADPDYINKLFAFKHLNQNAVAGLDCGVAIGFDGNFAHEFHRRQVVLAQVPARGLREARLFHEFHQADLRAVVAVFGLRLVLRNHARPRLQHGRRMHLAPRVEQLRHSDFFP